ncbi:MAG: ABC transporter substrate-binding protein [Chloroflexota bacterium]|jgi:NitT/TauT family transport system substrate-binding protein
MKELFQILTLPLKGREGQGEEDYRNSRNLAFSKVVKPLLAIVLSLGIALAGCSSQPSSNQEMVLKIGVLPIVDTLPMYVAELEGYNRERNLAVELVLFPSALERDSAFVAGQVDGVLNDPVAAALLNKDGEKAKIVRLAFKGNPSMAMMVVLASPNSRIQSPLDLKGVPIGISRNSVIEYTTDRLLQSAGLELAEIEKTEVSKMPVRAEMLTKDQLSAATLPEPLASLAQLQGARRVIDDSKTGTGQSLITMHQRVVTENPDLLRRFLASYEEAVETINVSPNKYRDLMVDKAKVPDELKTSFDVPQFDKGQLPSRADVEDVIQWMVEKKLLDNPIPYDDLVADGLLPE